MFPKQESRHFDDLVRKDVQPKIKAAHLIKKIRKRFLLAKIHGKSFVMKVKVGKY